jgi:hypothetical protein
VLSQNKRQARREIERSGSACARAADVQRARVPIAYPILPDPPFDGKTCIVILRGGSMKRIFLPPLR